MAPGGPEMSFSTPQSGGQVTTMAPGEAQPLPLDEAAARLGPFSPPSNYRFEPELSGRPPRTVPNDCRAAPVATKARQAAIICILMGLACLLAARVHVLHELSYYILPLGYLSWIGLGLAVIGGVLLLSIYLPDGPFAVPYK